MTNRKFKDYQLNKLAYDALNKNFELLCRYMLTLNKLFPKQFYAKTIQNWLHHYADNVTVVNKWDDDGIKDYKFKQYVNQYQIDDHKLLKFVMRYSKGMGVKSVAALVTNIELALIQTAEDFGFGIKRLEKIQDYLVSEHFENPVEEVKKFGINDLMIEQEDLGKIDVRKAIDKHKKLKQKTTLKEQFEERRKIEAFRKWTAENVGGNKI